MAVRCKFAFEVRSKLEEWGADLGMPPVAPHSGVVDHYNETLLHIGRLTLAGGMTPDFLQSVSQYWQLFLLAVEVESAPTN